jgi:hypothetical protein
MLSPSQLRILPIDQQKEYVWQYGKFVDSKSEGETTINMYWMGNYYAELIYNTISNQVENIVLKEAFHDD